MNNNNASQQIRLASQNGPARATNDGGGPLLRDAPGDRQAGAKTSAAAGATGSTGAANQSVCCPIWALAMELLDLSQAQPRDQSRHDHLLGPPSSLAYLLAPAAELDR
jgi:hypothetical protein